MSYHCRTCSADLTDDAIVEGADVWEGVPVHLHDFGPRHDQLAVHPVHSGEAFGVPYVHPTERPGYVHPMANVIDYTAPTAGLVPNPAGWIIGPDVSQWQSALYGPTFGRQFGIYRLSLSTTLIDTHGKANAAWCAANSPKQLVFHMGYHVWYPGNLAAQITRFLAAGLFDDPESVAMFDIESWSGSISGDHSVELNQGATQLADELGSGRVKRYGNEGDLASLWRSPPKWLGQGVADYNSSPPGIPHDFWQFTDGSTAYPVPAGFPRTSAPFGACDHNAFYGNAAQMATIFGVQTAPPIPPVLPANQEDQMYIVEVDATGDGKGDAYYLLGDGRYSHITDMTQYAKLVAAKDVNGKAAFPVIPVIFSQAQHLEWLGGPAVTPPAPVPVNVTVNLDPLTLLSTVGEVLVKGAADLTPKPQATEPEVQV